LLNFVLCNFIAALRRIAVLRRAASLAARALPSPSSAK
jgi:hypothetical protein